MYSNRIVRTKVSSDFQGTCSNSFKRQQFHTQTGSISPCRITADNFYTTKNFHQAQPKVDDKGLKKAQIETFVQEIEKLNDVLKKKVCLINELTKKFNQSEDCIQQKSDELIQQKLMYQKQNEELQIKIQELLLMNKQLEDTNFHQQQELETLFIQIEQYNKESEKFKETLKNSQTLYSESEVKQLKAEIVAQKQEISKLQIQLMEEKKDSNQLKLQIQNINQQAQIKDLEKQNEEQQFTIDNQKQTIAQLRKTINLLEQNISDQLLSENTYSQLLTHFNQYKEQQKDQEIKIQKQIKAKENEISELKNNFQSQQIQLEQSNLLVITLQSQNEKLKGMLQFKLDDFETKKVEPEIQQAPLNQHNKSYSKKLGKEYLGTPQSHGSQHKQINFIKEQFRQMPISSQLLEKELTNYKNKMNSPSNIKMRQDVKDLSTILNKKVY